MTTYHLKYYTLVLCLISLMLYSNHINPNVIFDLRSILVLKILVNTAADIQFVT